MGNQIHCSPIPGRVKSKLPTNMFKVKNINEQGEVIWRGLIEVNGTELVLHQKNGDPVRWPLKSLRRYGFDKGLFSFESGRSCATGPGIYAFKCRNAEQLFDMVKLNTNDGENASTSNAGPSRQQRNTTQAYMPHNHSTSMTHLISTNGRIAGRNSSSTSVGAMSPLSPSSRVHNSSPILEEGESPTVEYINAADIRETGPPRSTEVVVGYPSARPVMVVIDNMAAKETSKNVSLNYAHLKLGQDEEDAVVQDGSFQVTADAAGRVENEYEVDESEEAAAIAVGTAASSHIPEPTTILTDENDNKTIDPKSRMVKTGLLVEIGSEVNCLSETGRGHGKISYLNLDRSPKVTRPTNRVHSPDFGKKVPPTVYPASLSSYYTNLDTKGELPPHYTISGVIPEHQEPASSGLNGKSDLEFNFNSNVNPGTEKYYANLVNVEGKELNDHDPGLSNIIQSPPRGKLNYIQVAFEDGTVSSAPQRSMSSSSGSTPPNTPNSPLADRDSPTKVSEVYAVIDTNKTVALANSQRQINDGDVSSRRTRHDGPVQPR